MTAFVVLQSQLSYKATSNRYLTILLSCEAPRPSLNQLLGYLPPLKLIFSIAIIHYHLHDSLADGNYACIRTMLTSFPD